MSQKIKEQVKRVAIKLLKGYWIMSVIELIVEIYKLIKIKRTETDTKRR